MPSFFSRLGPWGWSFWILVFAFCVSQYGSAREALVYLASLEEGGKPSPEILGWIFLRNGLLGLGLSFVALFLSFVLNEGRGGEMGARDLWSLHTGALSFERAVYRHRREGRGFGFLICRWKERRGRRRFFTGGIKRAILSRLFVLAKEEIRLTDTLFPLDLETLGILVDGGGDEALVLARRIGGHVETAFDGASGERPELLWAVASYRPGDSLEELVGRARRSLEKGVLLDEGEAC